MKFAAADVISAPCFIIATGNRAAYREPWSRQRLVLDQPGDGGQFMAVVAAEPFSDYPWFIRLFFWKHTQTYGDFLDPGFSWRRSPGAFAAVALLYGASDRRSSPIAPALRSLVTVRVSQINHCAPCVDINSATLAERGVPMKEIDVLSDWRNSPLFTPEERLALDYAEAMTLNRVDDDLRQRLKQH